MDKRQLGNSDLKLTRLGFGAWAAGGGNWEFGWGPQDDSQSIAAIHRALERGINWIDTAAVYGLGHSEEVVAQALATWSGPRPYVMTKCSMRWSADRKIYRALDARSLREECEASLKRLGVDVIDLYQIHWPIPADGIEEGWGTLESLRREGKVRWIGVSNFDVQQIERARRIAPVTSLQPPYSAVKRGIEKDLLPYCAEHHIGVIVYSPMQAGLLTGSMTRERIAALPPDDWRRLSPEFAEPRLTRNLAVQAKLVELARARNTTAAAMALAWTLRHDVVTGAIVGARSASQVDGFADALTLSLSSSEIAAIDDAFHAR